MQRKQNGAPENEAASLTQQGSANVLRPGGATHIHGPFTNTLIGYDCAASAVWTRECDMSRS
jgi:hypothetical protein